MAQDLKTITITEFGGPLTRRNDGDINSGLAKYSPSWGYDPYSKPGNLTWFEQPTSILTIVGTAGPFAVMKSRASVTGTGNTNFVYALTPSVLYEIRVNATGNAEFDSPSVVGALIGDPNFARSAGMVFYGSPEKIIYSGDNAIGKINFNGSSPTSILSTSSLTSLIPHPLTTFIGKVYFGNGNNVGEIDSTELITTGTKLSPALPVGTYVRDLDITSDGNYLQTTSSRTAIGVGLSGASADINSGSAGISHKFLWNGIDEAATYSEDYGGLVLNSNTIFGNKNYTLGADFNGTAVFRDSEKILSLPATQVPNPNAVFSVGNMLGFATGEYDNNDNRFKASIFNYGKPDEDIPQGLFRLLRYRPTVGEVLVVPTCINTSNRISTPNVFGFSNDISVSSKLYFSTAESSVAGQSVSFPEYKIYKFSLSPTNTGSIVAGVYETQTQLFSKKVKVSEVRLYTEPLVSGNDFVVDLIGSGGSVMSGGSQRFIVGTSSVATGTDMVQFNPAMAPTYALGVRITNSSVTGVVNWTATKLEADIAPGGK